MRKLITILAILAALTAGPARAQDQIPATHAYGTFTLRDDINLALGTAGVFVLQWDTGTSRGRMEDAAGNPMFTLEDAGATLVFDVNGTITNTTGTLSSAGFHLGDDFELAFGGSAHASADFWLGYDSGAGRLEIADGSANPMYHIVDVGTSGTHTAVGTFASTESPAHFSDSTGTATVEIEAGGANTDAVVEFLDEASATAGFVGYDDSAKELRLVYAASFGGSTAGLVLNTSGEATFGQKLTVNDDVKITAGVNPLMLVESTGAFPSEIHVKSPSAQEGAISFIESGTERWKLLHNADSIFNELQFVDVAAGAVYQSMAIGLVDMPLGNLSLGSSSSQEGTISLAGDTTGNGGTIEIRPSDDVDTNTDHWRIYSNSAGDFVIRGEGGAYGASNHMIIEEDTRRMTLQSSGTNIYMRQSASGGGVAVVEIKNDDLSEPFILLTGTLAASTANNLTSWKVGATLQGFAEFSINGTSRWFPFYTAPTS